MDNGNKTETTMLEYCVYIYRGYVRRMEKKMETAIIGAS